MDDKLLTGHVILIIEPEVGRLACDLQNALEQAGAESLVARSPEAALAILPRFSFSAGVINCNGNIQDIQSVIGRVSNVPVVLYGDGAPAFAAHDMAPKLVVAGASVASIMPVLYRLLHRAV